MMSIGQPSETGGPEATKRALVYLADRCDGARTQDEQGFNGFDSGYGKSLAYQTYQLTAKQEYKAINMLHKYRRQLAAAGFDVMELAADYARRQRDVQQPAVRPNRLISLEGETFVISWGYVSRDTFDVFLRGIRQIPDRGYDSQRKLNTAPLESCLAVEQFAAANGFVFTPEAQDAVNAYRAAALAEQQRVEALIAASKAKDADIDLILGDQLYPFQRAGVQYALDRRRTFIADEMGLGKTRIALATVIEAGALPALVICPKSAALVWPDEIRMVLQQAGLSYTVQRLDGSSTAQLRLGEQTPDITVIHYDALPKRLDVLTSQFKALIVDECHLVKNKKAKRTELVQFMADRLDGPDPIILMLSGTPLVNRPEELVSQLTVMRRLGDLGGYRHYRRSYCGAGGNLNKLNTELRSTCMVRRLKKDVLTELPPRTFADVPTAMDNWSEYRQAERQFLLWVRQNNGVDAALRASRAEVLTRLNALRGLAAKGKLAAGLEWCRDFLEDAGKLVVFATHRYAQQAVFEQLADFRPRRIVAEMPVEERRAQIEQFQTVEPAQVFVMPLVRTVAMGVTLHAASNVAFFELGWSPVDMLQAVDRCHRIGQRDAVTGWQLVAPGTIDDFMAELLEEKRLVAEEALDGRAAADAAESSDITAELVGRMLDREERS